MLSAAFVTVNLKVTSSPLRTVTAVAGPCGVTMLLAIDRSGGFVPTTMMVTGLDVLLNVVVSFRVETTAVFVKLIV